MKETSELLTEIGKWMDNEYPATAEDIRRAAKELAAYKKVIEAARETLKNYSTYHVPHLFMALDTALAELDEATK